MQEFRNLNEDWLKYVMTNENKKNLLKLNSIYIRLDAEFFHKDTLLRANAGTFFYVPQSEKSKKLLI